MTRPSPHTPSSLFLAGLAAVAFLSGAACSTPPEPPAPVRETAPAAQGASRDQPRATGTLNVAQTAQTPQQAMPTQAPVRRAGHPTAPVQVSPDDPVQGKWSLDDATKGLPPGRSITATLDTDQGPIDCKLFDDKAPITVANFVGLARGLRPWKTPEGTWEKRPAYDGTPFHRIIKGFMIQGGDAKKNGSGEAGYVIPDEVWEGATHDRAGLLCMANRGPNTNSAQFFITDAAAGHLDSGYTIFGECSPLDTVHKIAAMPTQGDRPVTAPVIRSVKLSRR